MFRRGQKIRVQKYYGKGNMRPKVGDVGYLANVFLYPKLKLILADGMFFRYGKDSSNGRFEHKRFFIDVGMDKALKHRLVNVGVSRDLFINSQYINITPVGYSIADLISGGPLVDDKLHKKLINEYSLYGWNANHVWPKVTGSFGIWNNKYSERGKPKKDVKVKMPCLEITHDVVTKGDMLESENIYALKAWFMAAIAPIIYLMKDGQLKREFYYENGERGGLFKKISMLDYALFESLNHEKSMRHNDDGTIWMDILYAHESVGQRRLREWVWLMREIEVRHKMMLDKVDALFMDLVIKTLPRFHEVLTRLRNETAFNPIKKIWDVDITTMPNFKLYECTLCVISRSLLNITTSENFVNSFHNLGVGGNENFWMWPKEVIKENKRMMSVDNSLLKSVLK